MAFFLFLLLNAVLLIRPAEVVPELLEWHLYELTILACFAAAFPSVLQQLTPASLRTRPITACVLGLLAAIVLSHLSHFYFGGARDGAVEFSKVILYYLLLVGVVNTPARLRLFLGWLGAFLLVLTVLSLLQFHGATDIPNLKAVQEKSFDEETGEELVQTRLCYTGLFNNPNDLSRILVVGIPICLYWLGDRRAGAARLLWLVPLVVFGYALALTQSRGGFIALVVGLLVLFRSRYGTWKTVALAGVCLPVLLLLFAGRQTELSTREGTGQQRIQLWSEGFAAFKESPLFGTGMDTYPDYAGGYVAHNSFIHCYAELGLFGGTLFLGAFYFALWALVRMGAPPLQVLDPEMRRLRPYLLGVIAAGVAGMLTISRSYTVPVYMLLGLVTAYLGTAVVYPPVPITRLDGRLVGRLAVVSVAFVIGVYVFLRLFVRWG